MARIIAYDLCRLFIGPYFSTPRGIDRIDLAMANHVFADPDSPHIAILPTPLGVRAYPAWVARLFLDHLQAIWGERRATAVDDRLERLLIDMRSPSVAGTHDRSGPKGSNRIERGFRVLAMLRHTGVRIGQAAAKGVPANAIYVNFGQLALAIPPFFTWLDKRPDVACALMMHDTIPLDHPELVKPGSVGHHARMVATAAIRADCLVFSTAFAQASVNRALQKLGYASPLGLVRSLPLPASFANAGHGFAALADTQYFVAVSTIEPRKNYGLLLRVWAALIDRMGARAPHLVIVGARGLNADQILSPLAAAPRLRERVHQVSGLSSPSLARLVSGSAGVLSPSFAEGFGLPLLEGMAMGVPTIASDIPSHREIAGKTTTLLDAGDQAGWEAAILATPRPAPGRRGSIAVATTEAAYCADILTFLDTVPSTLHNRRMA